MTKAEYLEGCALPEPHDDHFCKPQNQKPDKLGVACRSEKHSFCHNSSCKCSCHLEPPVESLDSILEEAFNNFYDYITEKDIIKVAHEYSEKTVYKQARAKLERLIQTSNREAVRLGQVKCATEMSSLDQEIVSLKAEIKRLTGGGQ